MQADIERVRDPSEQTKRMGVPESHLGGHAFHTYRSVAMLHVPLPVVMECIQS